jgi:hypothetical protein
MNDLGRRYFLFVGTHRGKRIFVAVLIGVAALMDIAASTLSASGHKGPPVVTLFSLAAGFIGAAGILMLMNRRPT